MLLTGIKARVFWHFLSCECSSEKHPFSSVDQSQELQLDLAGRVAIQSLEIVEEKNMGSDESPADRLAGTDGPIFQLTMQTTTTARGIPA